MPFWKQSGFSYAGGDNTATIASTITLHDNMTAVLNRQANAANTLLNRFSALDTATDSFDPSAQWTMANGALSEMAEYMGRLVSLTQENNSQLSRMSDNIENMGQQMQRSTDQAGSLTSVLKRAAAAFGGITAVKKVFDLSDTLTSTTARLDLMNDGLQTTAQLSQQIFQSAQRSRGSYQTTADAVSKLGLMAGDAFDSSGEIVAFMEQINKQFTIAGTESAGIDAAMLQLTQAMGSGVLRGEEYNSVLEQAPNIIQSIADYLDVPKGKLKDMAADGKITADIVKNAIFAAADETNAKFNSMPQTMAQVWTSFKNQALSAFQPVLQQINELANSDSFLSVLDTLVAMLTAVFDVLSAVAAVVQWAADNWSVLGPVLFTVVGALAAYKAATLLTAAAQWILNGAWLACPVTWVVLAIAALVGILAVVINAINSCTGSSLSLGGVIGGSLMVALAALGNAFIWIANVGVGVWEWMCALCENIPIAFHNAIASVQSWWYSLLSTVLTVVEGICEALNKIPFIEFDYSGVSNAAADFAAKSAEAAGNKQEYKDLGAAFDKGFNTFEYMNLGEAWDAGYAMGDGLFNSDGASSTGYDATDLLFSDQPTGAADDPIHTSVDNDVNIADEDLQLMRDVAEARYVQNFVTLTPTVQVSGNTINEKVDVNTVVDEIENRLTNEIAASAEGAYG